MAQQELKYAWSAAVIVMMCALLTQEVIAQSPLVRIVTSEEPPTNYTLNGKFSGISTDIVKTILSELGQDIPIEIYPWARAYNIALSAPNVVIFTAGKTQERVEHGFFFIGPVSTRRHSLYKKSGRKLTAESIEDVIRQGLKVGAMRGDWRAGYLEDRGVTVDFVVEHAQNIKKLMANRIDLFVLSDLELTSALDQAGIDHGEVELALVFDERPAYILLSKGTPEAVVDQWRRVFAALQASDFFQKQSRKWNVILGIPVVYAPDTGFMKDSRASGPDSPATQGDIQPQAPISP